MHRRRCSIGNDRRRRIGIDPRKVPGRGAIQYAAAGKAAPFEELRGFRLDAPEPRAYAAVSVRLGLSESAVKSAIRRFRQRHRQLVREETALTMADPAEVDGEIRHLLPKPRRLLRRPIQGFENDGRGE